MNNDSLTVYSRRRVMGSEQEYGIMHCGSWKLNSYNVKNDGFINNGSRLYIDCYHPEYASAEASNPLDALIYDKAGEIIVQREVRGMGIRLFKNNRDITGHSFASHESYSLGRTDTKLLIDKILPFLTSRMIFAGGGFINEKGQYELSQRAEVTDNEISDSATSGRRSIFNTKDESLADSSKYMRLHVVNGDANLAEPALFLKYGTMGLVLDLFEDNLLKPFILDDAVNSFREISKDLTFSNKYAVYHNDEINFNDKLNSNDKKMMTAIQMQRVYQKAAERAYRGRDEMTDDILNRWGYVLDTLQEDPMKLDRWLDWAIKKKLIDSYMQKTGKALNSPEVKDIDLQYHEVNRERGLFYKLQDAGLVDRVVTDEQIIHAVDNPPQDTRARFRGLAVKEDNYLNSWNGVHIKLERADKEERCFYCPEECIQYRYITKEFMINDPLNDYRELDDLLKNPKLERFKSEPRCEGI